MEGGKVNFEKETGEGLAKNAFLIKRLSVTPNSPSVEVDFSPLQGHLSSQQDGDKQNCHSFPVFNRDSCYYTPAFALQVDQRKYVANAAAYESLHESKKQELCEQKTELFVARPSRPNSFCTICKNLFDDYLTHVTNPAHQKLMHESPYTQSITELCSLFSEYEVEEECPRNKKRGKKIEKSVKRKGDNKKYLNVILMSSPTSMGCSPDRREEVAV